MDPFTLAIGLSLHNPDWDKPEIELDALLGVVRIEQKQTEDVTVFCEHISAIRQEEIGYGLNHCGVMVRFK